MDDRRSAHGERRDVRHLRVPARPPRPGRAAHRLPAVGLGRPRTTPPASSRAISWASPRSTCWPSSPSSRSPTSSGCAAASPAPTASSGRSTRSPWTWAPVCSTTSAGPARRRPVRQRDLPLADHPRLGCRVGPPGRAAVRGLRPQPRRTRRPPWSASSSSPTAPRWPRASPSWPGAWAATRSSWPSPAAWTRPDRPLGYRRHAGHAGHRGGVVRGRRARADGPGQRRAVGRDGARLPATRSGGPRFCCVTRRWSRGRSPRWLPPGWVNRSIGWPRRPEAGCSRRRPPRWSRAVEPLAGEPPSRGRRIQVPSASSWSRCRHAHGLHARPAARLVQTAAGSTPTSPSRTSPPAGARCRPGA